MGVSDLLPMLTDGGSDAEKTADVHVECRQCGKNLAADAGHCPDCGGDVAVHDL